MTDTALAGGIRMIPVRIGGQDHLKPWDPACPACQSPWLLEIDELLAAGHSCEAITRLLAGRRPPPPEPGGLAPHVIHLAVPHRDSRLHLEDAAAARGEEHGLSLVRDPDVLDAIIRRGYERMTAGTENPAVMRETLQAMRLRLDMQRAALEETADASEWEEAFLAFFELARRYIPQASYDDFARELSALPVITELRQRRQEPPALPMEPA
jgi:hypothetical protein